MNIKTTLCLIGVAALLAACAVKSTNAVTKPNEAKSGFMGLNKTASVVVDNNTAFTGKNQVVIGSFKVAFLEGKKDSNKAGSGMGGKATAKTNLTGLTPAVMQAVTDAAYNDFVAKLKSSGYTVADRSSLLSDANYSATTSVPSPMKEEASFFGSKTDVTYVAPTGFNDIRFFMGEAGKGLGMSAIGNNPYTAAVKYAKASGIPVISVIYTVDYANASGTTSHFALTSNMEVGQGISATAGSGITFVGGEGGGTFGANPNATVKLGQAVYSTEPYGEVITTTTGAGVAAEVALNVFTSVLGGGSNQTREFEIRADPAKYQVVATSVLQQANGDLIGKMASLK